MRKVKKKATALLLAAAICAVMLSGCTSQASGPASDEEPQQDRNAEVLQDKSSTIYGIYSARFVKSNGLNALTFVAQDTDETCWQDSTVMLYHGSSSTIAEQRTNNIGTAEITEGDRYIFTKNMYVVNGESYYWEQYMGEFTYEVTDGGIKVILQQPDCVSAYKLQGGSLRDSCGLLLDASDGDLYQASMKDMDGVNCDYHHSGTGGPVTLVIDRNDFSFRYYNWDDDEF